MQLYDPGSKHTLSPIPAADEAACCVACMELASCFGAELFGGSCYLKTAKLPLVNQTPPKGVTLVACVKNQSTYDFGASVCFAHLLRSRLTQQWLVCVCRWRESREYSACGKRDCARDGLWLGDSSAGTTVGDDWCGSSGT